MKTNQKQKHWFWDRWVSQLLVEEFQAVRQVCLKFNCSEFPVKEALHRVYGCDLSEARIKYARQKERESFEVLNEP